MSSNYDPALSLNYFFQEAIRNNWDRTAMTDFNGTSHLYKDVARKIAKLHIFFEEIGIRPGDKVALCGRNSSSWSIAFIATITYGAVIVPILHEFKADNIHHLINHSESKLLFVDNSIWDNLDPAQLKGLKAVLHLKDFALLRANEEKVTSTRAHLNELFGHRYPDRFSAEDISYFKDTPDELCLISYTSGSTGVSKGVMLPYRSLWSNVRFCMDNIHRNPGDGVVCMLPLAHMYGLSMDMLFPFSTGCHINFLTKTPSPRIIIEAFAQVKPKIIITVPLIIEKIIKTRVFPLLEKPLMKILMHVPFVDDRLLARIKERLTETFGGNLDQIIIGGAGLNKDVEAFLRKITFPYTVGYGMTECGPLISYTPWQTERAASCGTAVDRMELRIDSPDPASTPGVLYTRGMNVMLGYYKNPEATEAVLDADGWLNTGDIGNLDADGFLYIRGRDKNMILGPSGQNIYPEEIEEKLNNMPYVSESLIIDSGEGRLIALIYPDLENLTAQHFSQAQIEAIMEENIANLNHDLPAYSQIQRFRLYDEEFEKTPKRSIKRYLYQHQ